MKKTIDKNIMRVMKNDFVVFILTHGRANNVITYQTLRNKGYKGRIVLVVDNEDEQIDIYKRNFGNNDVVVFDKNEVAKNVDEQLRGDRRVVVFARNACFAIAKELGYRYFMELDDDYRDFLTMFNAKREYSKKSINHSLTEYIAAMLKFFIATPPCVKSIAMAQGGDFIGGAKSSYAVAIRMKRKVMNSFICDTERPFQFVGWINEDTNTYCVGSHRGEVFFTICSLRLEQVMTQQNDGGLTDAYLDKGTYVKSFCSVVYHPSGVKVSTMGFKERRVHHKVNWQHTAPKILSEKWKK